MTTQLAPAPVFRSWDNSGNPLAGGQLFSYVAGTTTPQATYVDSTQTTQNTNPVILNARGEASVWLDPTLTYKLVLQDSLGNQIWSQDQIVGGYVPVSQLASYVTQSFIGQQLYPRTAAEVTANITPLNFFYPPMYPERYGNNTTPGTTDMTAAVQAACSVARIQGGTVVLGTSGTYLTTAALDCTFQGGAMQQGMIIKGLGGAGTANSTGLNYNILASHNGVAIFDCTGNDHVIFENLTIGTAIPASTFPQVGILLARNSTKDSLINHLKQVKIFGYFSVSCYYNYGSENSLCLGCYFGNWNPAANVAARIYTATNIAGLVSPYATIATGGVSCIGHDDFGNADWINSGTATSDCVRLEGIAHHHRYGGFCGNVGGRSAYYVYSLNALSAATTSSNVVIIGLQIEQTITLSTYGILFAASASTVTPIGWVIKDSRLLSNASGGFAIAAADVNTNFDGFQISGISEFTSQGLSCPGVLQDYSFLHTGAMVLNIGTVTNGTIVGLAANWTIGSRTGNNLILDQTAITGYGTPTGGSHQGSFAAGSITLPNLAAGVAQLIIDLKAKGLIQA